MLPTGTRCPASSSASVNSRSIRSKPCMRRLSQVIEHRAGKHARSCSLFQQTPRQAPPDTAEVSGSAGVPVQVGASCVRRPRAGGCSSTVADQAAGAGHGERRAGRACGPRSGVPGPALPAWLSGAAAGRRAGDPVPDPPWVPGAVPPACLQQIGDAFRRRVSSFAEANHIPVVPLKAADPATSR